MATQVKQICFLSAPYGQNIDSLLRVLGDSGVDVTRLDNLVPGAEIPESVRAAVQEADFFCAVLPEGSSNANVLFELGIAAGLEKCLFLVVEPGVDLPLDLRRLPYVRASLSDANSLESRIPPALRTFLNGQREEDRAPSVAHEIALPEVTQARTSQAERSIIVPIQSFAPAQIEPAKEIHVVVQPSDGGYIATLFDATLSIDGDTQEEAVESLKQLILDVFEQLEAEEHMLAPGMARQLAVLRSLLKKP